jgi:hypothetical protein
VQRLRDTGNFRLRTKDRGRDRSRRVVELKVPPRSPDLNPRDFLWGHSKQLVYSQPINSVELTEVRTQGTGVYHASMTTFSAFTANKVRYAKSKSAFYSYIFPT